MESLPQPLQSFLTANSRERALHILQQTASRSDLLGTFARALLGNRASQLLNVGRTALTKDQPVLAAYAFFYALPLVDTDEKSAVWHHAYRASKRARLLHLVALLWLYRAYREGPSSAQQLVEQAIPEVRPNPPLELLLSAEAAFWRNGELLDRIHKLLPQTAKASNMLEAATYALARGAAYFILGRQEPEYLVHADRTLSQAENLFDIVQARFFHARAATLHAICLHLQTFHTPHFRERLLLIRRIQQLCNRAIAQLEPLNEPLALSILHGNLGLALGEEARCVPQVVTRIRLLSASADAIRKAAAVLSEDQAARRGLHLLNLGRSLSEHADLTFERDAALQLLREAAQVTEEALHLLSKVGYLRGAAMAANNLSSDLVVIAEYDQHSAEKAARQALSYAEQAIDLGNQCGDEGVVASALLNKGRSLVLLAALHDRPQDGRYAAEALTRAAQLQESRQPRFAAIAYWWLSYAHVLQFVPTQEVDHLKRAQEALERAASLYEAAFDFCRSLHSLLSATKYAITLGQSPSSTLDQVVAAIDRLSEVVPEEKALYRDLKTLLTAYRLVYEGWRSNDLQALDRALDLLQGLQVCRWTDGIRFVRGLSAFLRGDEAQGRSLLQRVASTPDWLDARTPFTLAWQARILAEGGALKEVFLEPPYRVLAPLYANVSLLLQTAFQAYQAVAATTAKKQITLAEIRRYVEEIRRIHSLR